MFGPPFFFTLFSLIFLVSVVTGLAVRWSIEYSRDHLSITVVVVGAILYFFADWRMGVMKFADRISQQDKVTSIYATLYVLLAVSSFIWAVYIAAT